jgi:transposase
MSNKEAERFAVIEQVSNGKLKQRKAMLKLGLSRRQIIRLVKKYRAEGVSGLISRKRGQRSNRRHSERIKKQVKELIFKDYSDFGPTLAAEKLLERDGLKVNKETLRQWMLGWELWKAKRRKKVKIHQSREPRECFGELIQIDGSPHDWFEGRAEKCCLLVFVDDATSKLVQLLFVPSETTMGYFAAAREYVERCGAPVAFYSDKHGIFRINLPEYGSEGKTQFQRACGELNIKLICAHSPQAKGRVERANGVLQDRLVKDLRLKGISDIETANAYLPKFMKAHNAKFEKMPKNSFDMHRKLNKTADELALIFSIQEDRKLSKNLEFSYKSTIYQIQVIGQGYGLRHAKVKVCETLDGKTRVICMGKERTYITCEKRKCATDIVDTKELNRRIDALVKWKPAKDHPWRQYKNEGSVAQVGCHTC